jgi:antitoxin VapB
MALSIKTDEADRLARELADLAGESVTEAVTVALRERLERIREDRRSRMESRLDLLVKRYKTHEVADERTDEEIIGYDGRGLPS